MHDLPPLHLAFPVTSLTKAEAWQALAARLETAGTRFIVVPHIHFKDQPGEQAAMFLLDPCGHTLAFKAFADRSRLFAQ